MDGSQAVSRMTCVYIYSYFFSFVLCQYWCNSILYLCHFENVPFSISWNYFLFTYTSSCFSAFHLSYNMLLNQLRCEDGDPESLLRNSFYQFQADRALPDLEVGINRVDVQYLLCLWSFPVKRIFK